MGKFENKIAVVTGAGGTLCSEIAIALAAEGAKVYLVGRTAEKLQKVAAQKIVALRLSVRQAEAMCKSMATKKPEKPQKPLGVDYVAECEKTLTKHMGRKVKIVSGKRKGRFELEFYDQEDLQLLYETLLSLESKK